MHREQGLLIASGPGVATGTTVTHANIVDLAPTFLHWLGLEVPGDMDGRPLEGLMGDEFRRTHPVRLTAPSPSASVRSPEHVFTDAEEREIMQRLRDLGYLN